MSRKEKKIVKSDVGTVSVVEEEVTWNMKVGMNERKIYSEPYRSQETYAWENNSLSTFKFKNLSLVLDCREFVGLQLICHWKRNDVKAKNWLDVGIIVPCQCMPMALPNLREFSLRLLLLTVPLSQSCWLVRYWWSEVVRNSVDD